MSRSTGQGHPAEPVRSRPYSLRRGSAIWCDTEQVFQFGGEIMDTKAYAIGSLSDVIELGVCDRQCCRVVQVESVMRAVPARKPR